MANNKKFMQEGKEGSTNIQAVNYYGGLTYKDAKEIALEVFKDNFNKLSTVAAQVANERAEKLVEGYLSKLQQEKPELIENVNNPDIQYALFTAQKEFARSGDENVGEMLVELLFERTKVQERNLKQIVLNEAIEVLPKLNTIQLNILSLLFVIDYVRFYNVSSIPILKDTFYRYYEPFITESIPSDNQFLHLEYCGCINTERIASRELLTTIKNYYPGLFSRGFSEEAIVQRFGSELTQQLNSILFRKCLHNESLFQINAIDKTTIEDMVNKHGLDSSLLDKLYKLFEEDLMTDSQIKDKIIEIYPHFEYVVKCWDNTAIKSSRLTTVGIAIAHANLIMKCNAKADLEIWIN